MTAPERPTVLVIDDQFLASRLLERILTPHHNVRVAQGALEAFAILKSEKVHLVLLDISLPGLSGIDLCEKIRADGTLGHIPVIMVSGLASEEDRKNGLRAGADDFIEKPFDSDKLVALVDEAIYRNN
jgi:two-component system, cell cycle response regulator